MKTRSKISEDYQRLSILSLLFLIISLGMSSCEKTPTESEPDLPPLTTSGQMTFGCYVNGEPWVAEVPPFQPYHRHTGGATFSAIS